MTTASVHRPKAEPALAQRIARETRSAGGVIAWSSFVFALLQSLCTFFAALDGLRVVIGVSSLVVSAGVGRFIGRAHADWIRVPMILVALFGSLLNLLVLWQVRRLRHRPAAKWRQKPPTPRKLRMERIQLILSIATLALIGYEEYLHHHWHHHF